MNGINPDAPQQVTDVAPLSDAQPMPGPVDHSNYDPQVLAHANVTRDVPGQGSEHPAVRAIEQDAAAQTASPAQPSREYALGSIFTGDQFVIGSCKLSDIQADGSHTIEQGLAYTDLEAAYADLMVIQQHLLRTLIATAYKHGQESNATTAPTSPDSQPQAEAKEEIGNGAA